jgi:transposase
MTEGTAESKIRAVRALLADPFFPYTELTERESRAALLASRGTRTRIIGKMLGVSKRTAYRLLDAAAEKIAAQDGREEFTRDDLVAHVHEKLIEIVR